MAETITVEVLAHKSCTTTFIITVDAKNHRANAEAAIEEKLRSDKGLVWVDFESGINVLCFYGDNIWRPRKRFLEYSGEDE